MFRPCIDLHNGKVKQIVGGSLRDNGPAPLTNFETAAPASYFATLYKDDGLSGGHVIMLGPGNDEAARAALAAFPGGMQIGGGIRPDNAEQWLEAGASHVIVTSYVFREGRIDWERLEEIKSMARRERLVLDLSCRKRDGRYFVVTDRWQKFTDTELDPETLVRMADYAIEFLVHAADVEGKREGLDYDLVKLLGDYSPIVSTYAGGAQSLDDLRRVFDLGRGRVNLTIGSALNIFGGSIPYHKVVELDRQLRQEARDQ